MSLSIGGQAKVRHQTSRERSQCLNVTLAPQPLCEEVPRSVTSSHAELLHHLAHSNASRVRNESHESLPDVLDLIVVVQQLDVAPHSPFCMGVGELGLGLVKLGLC